LFNAAPEHIRNNTRVMHAKNTVDSLYDRSVQCFKECENLRGKKHDKDWDKETENADKRCIESVEMFNNAYLHLLSVLRAEGVDVSEHEKVLGGKKFGGVSDIGTTSEGTFSTSSLRSSLPSVSGQDTSSATYSSSSVPIVQHKDIGSGQSNIGSFGTSSYGTSSTYGTSGVSSGVGSSQSNIGSYGTSSFAPSSTYGTSGVSSGVGSGQSNISSFGTSSYGTSSTYGTSGSTSGFSEGYKPHVGVSDTSSSTESTSHGGTFSGIKSAIKSMIGRSDTSSTSTSTSSSHISSDVGKKHDVSESHSTTTQKAPEPGKEKVGLHVSVTGSKKQ